MPIRRIVCAVALIVVAQSFSSVASSPAVFACVAKGTLDVYGDISDQTWTIAASGRCLSPGNPAVYHVSVSGGTKSGGFGCVLNPLDGYANGVPPFSVDVTLSAPDGSLKSFHQFWMPDLSYYPPGGLFLVSKTYGYGPNVGAGALATRLALVCNGGEDTAVVAWTFHDGRPSVPTP